MAISVLGTPANIANGGTYAAEAGSLRLVVMIALSESGTPPSLTSITWGSITRTPTISDVFSSSVLSSGWCIFQEADTLPSSPTTVTANWSATPSAGSTILCYTLGGALQSIAAQFSSGSLQGTENSPISLALTGISSGVLCIGAAALRSNASTPIGQVGWTGPDFSPASLGSGAGWATAAHDIASGTSDTYSISFTGPTDVIADVLGFAPGVIVVYTPFTQKLTFVNDVNVQF